MSNPVISPMTASSTDTAYRTLSQEEYDDIASRILYEDNHVLVLNKRAGEITQGDKTGDEPLPEKLKAFIAARDHKPGRVFMGVPHRLDRPVSGAVILAKTSKALERLSGAFREGDAGKIYWALVEKSPEPPQGEIRSWLTQPSAATARSQGGPAALPPAQTHQKLFSRGSAAADRTASSDPLSACLDRMPDQGRP